MIETTKAKETYWVLAVPEVAKHLLEYAGELWGNDPLKRASVVLCSGAVGKGALSLDMTPEFSAVMKESLEMLGKRLEELEALRVQKKPQSQWEPPHRI